MADPPYPSVSEKNNPQNSTPPKRPLFRATDNKTEILLALCQGGKGQSGGGASVVSLVERSGTRFRIPLSLGAGIYRQLEREGILRPIRGSGTLLKD